MIADKTKIITIPSPKSSSVSIIIPAYNAAETIAQTLSSVINQTYRNWETIVIDDGSTDGTGKLVRGFTKKDSRVRMIRQRQLGEAGARNTGIASAHCEWLLFLDADDWISSSHLERMMDELCSNPELDAVHCGSARVAKDGTLIVEKYSPPTGDMFPTLARRAAFPVHACIVRKSLVEAVGQFDTTLQKSPDWDLWQRIARTGARFGAVREVLAFYRMRSDASSLEAYQLFHDGLRVLKQGHSSDPRVLTPHPSHAAGLPADQILHQEFYLLCWCAGLLLGRGKDARPLLRLLQGDRYTDLYPDAVAQCIFESAPLPSCKPPDRWEEFGLKILSRIDEFLVALEVHTGTKDIARRAGDELRKMILKHSPNWKKIIDDYEQLINEQEIWIDELKQKNTQLHQLIQQTEGLREKDSTEHQFAIENMDGRIRELQSTIENKESRMQELQCNLERIETEGQNLRHTIEEIQLTIESKDIHIQEVQTNLTRVEEECQKLQTSNETLEKDREKLQRTIEMHLEMMRNNQALIQEMQNQNELLDNEREHWRRTAEGHQLKIESNIQYIQQLEDSRIFLEQDGNEWKALAEDRRLILSNLKKTFWVRLGWRLRMLKIPKQKQKQELGISTERGRDESV